MNCYPIYTVSVIIVIVIIIIVIIIIVIIMGHYLVLAFMILFLFVSARYGLFLAYVDAIRLLMVELVFKLVLVRLAV